MCTWKVLFWNLYITFSAKHKNSNRLIYKTTPLNSNHICYHTTIVYPLEFFINILELSWQHQLTYLLYSSYNPDKIEKMTVKNSPGFVYLLEFFINILDLHWPHQLTYLLYGSYNSDKIEKMTVKNSPGFACGQVLYSLKMSRLNYLLQETPFSINITIRTKIC